MTIEDFPGFLWAVFVCLVGTPVVLVVFLIAWILYPITIRIWDFLPYFSLFCLWLCLKSWDSIFELVLRGLHWVSK